MTVTFNCPNCGSTNTFDREHCGRLGRCEACGQLFIIPMNDNEAPAKYGPEVAGDRPPPSFYGELFVESWKIFINPANATSLVFVAAVVLFKFFLAEAACCVNLITYVVAWGWLFGFYLNVIYETAFGTDELPQIYLGTSITFLWYVIKPFFIFVFTMAVVQTPFIITAALLRNRVTAEDMWKFQSVWHVLVQASFIFGLFLFPAAILTVAVGKDIAMLRPDYLLPAVFKAFGPYIIVVFLLVTTAAVETRTEPLDTSASVGTNAVYVALNLVVQVLAITAMRAIGLFYRHYNHHFRW